jgi:hypothetical protein
MSGWTDQQCFFDYLEKLFIPNTKHLKRPILLIFDGHHAHLSIKVVRLAIQNEIHLLCLPSHSTHILQPLDVYTLRYVKLQCEQLLWDRNKTTSKSLDKYDFVQLFSKLYEYALIPTHCSTAFGKAGIYPFDPRAAKNDRVVKTTLSTTILPEQQQISPTVPNESNSLLYSNSQSIIPSKRLTRSNSAPDLLVGKFCTDFIYSCFTLTFIDHAISTTNSLPESHHTQLDTNLLHDSTTAAYDLLNNVLDQTTAFKSTTPTGAEAFSTTTATCQPDPIHLSVSISSINTTVSPVASPERSNHLIFLQKISCNQLYIFIKF